MNSQFLGSVRFEMVTRQATSGFWRQRQSVTRLEFAAERAHPDVQPAQRSSKGSRLVPASSRTFGVGRRNRR